MPAFERLSAVPRVPRLSSKDASSCSPPNGCFRQKKPTDSRLASQAESLMLPTGSPFNLHSEFETIRRMISARRLTRVAGSGRAMPGKATVPQPRTQHEPQERTTNHEEPQL